MEQQRPPAAVHANIQRKVQAVLTSTEYPKILNSTGFEPSRLRDSRALHQELLADYDRVGAALEGAGL